jgi:hypothetical protein
VRGGCLVPDGDLEGCLVHLFDGDGTHCRFYFAIKM